MFCFLSQLKNSYEAKAKSHFNIGNPDLKRNNGYEFFFVFFDMVFYIVVVFVMEIILDFLGLQKFWRYFHFQ